MKKATAAVLLLLAAVVLSAQATPEVEITNEGNHHHVLENELVRVYQVEVAPQQATLMHWHHHDYFYVILGGSDVSNEVKGKAPGEVELKDGQTGFSPASFAHVARNLHSRPFRNGNIERMQDEKFPNAPPNAE